MGGAATFGVSLAGFQRAGEVCNGALVCDGSNRCRTSCGGPDEHCCRNPPCDDRGLCSIFGTCQTCGGADQICCSGGVCDEGFRCGQGGPGLICRPACGFRGEPCCNGTDCPDVFLFCAPDQICRPKPCGHEHSFCCENGTCNTIYTCLDGICILCGHGNTPCCPGGECLPNLDCDPDNICR